MDTSAIQQAAVPPHVPADLVVDFDLYDPPGGHQDFQGAWKRLQDKASGDVVWTTANGGHWIALRGKLISDVFADSEHFSSRCIIVPRERGDQIKVLPTTLDPPAHQPYRALLNAGLSPKAVRRSEPQIRELVVSTIEAFRGRGSCEFVSEYAEILPISIFMQLVDLPVEDARILKPWADQINRPDGSMSPPEVMEKFADYLRPYLLQRRATPTEDLLSLLVNKEVNGRPLPESEALELCTQVLIGGMDTVISFLGFMMKFLAENPDHRRQLVEEPKLIPQAVEEFLRRFPIVINGRLVISDLEYHGVPLRSGDMMIIPGPLHGLDEREHEDPLRVDFRRFSRGHSTFGNGAHRCPGAQLARAELRITLEEWMPRIPDFEIDPGKPVKMEGGIVGCVTSLPLRWA